MAKAISIEKRMDIIKHRQNGKSSKNIANWLFLSVRTVERVWSKFKSTGSYAPEPQKSGRKPLVDKEKMKKIVAKINKQPDITINELIEKFDLEISESGLSKKLKKIGLTYKKRHCILMDKNEKMLSKHVHNGEIINII